MARQITFAHQTDIGQVRENNADVVYGFVAPPSEMNPNSNFGLFILADGFGSDKDGAKASTLTVETISQYVMDNLYPQWVKGILQNDDATVLEILRQAISEANEKVYEDVPDGGSTVIVILIVNGFTYLNHVGDCRAYLINELYYETIARLTTDHADFMRFSELGQHTLEPELPRYGYALRDAVGISEELKVDTHMAKINVSDSYILLCSDGLWKFVTEYEFLKTLYRYDIDLQAKCSELVTLANARGGRDNISVILCNLG